MAKRSQSPNWNKKTLDYVTDLSDDFHENLRRITVRLARHEGADNIEVRHVKNAYDSLCTIGLRRRPWWKRTELETAAGAFIVSLAISASDISNVVGSTLALNPEQQEKIAVGLFVGGLLAGVVLVIHGWIRGNH